jgi:dTDP-4-amino-4,6-dideoxygalactose transaminase
MQAALGCAQLAQIEKISAARKQMFSIYQRHLSNIPGLMLQHFTPDVTPLPWVVAVKLDPRAYPQGRDRVMLDMQVAGIETRPGFYTPTAMRHLYRSSPLPVADDVSAWVVALPSFASLNEQQIETVCGQLKRLRH